MKYFFLIITITFVACTFKKDKSNASKKTDKVSLAAPTTSIDSLAIQYLGLKDAFIKDISASVDSVNALFVSAINAVKMDSSLYSKNKIAVDSLLLLSTNIAKGTSIPQKLVAFKDITSPIKSISKGNTSYKLYMQHCPMAGEYSKDEKVYWLSAEDKVYNPFYPKTMGRCGVVVDTIQAK